MAVAKTPISLTSIIIPRKSTSTVMMGAKTSSSITSTMTVKETALIVAPQTQKTKSVRQKNLLSSLGIA